MQALSHFSYHKTGGQLVLCDLQGGMMSRGRGAVLTGKECFTLQRLHIEYLQRKVNVQYL
jgi:hypothetical protein